MNRAALLPLALFAGLALLFGWALFSVDPDRVPSALIGKPVPEFALEPVEGLDTPGLASADLAQGQVSVVNVWASWCVPCRVEHPILEEMARTAPPDVTLVGLNYKDAPSAASRFLDELGNPFSRIGADRTGRVGIDWGVYGVPETFIVDGQGRIAFKHVGPLTPEIVVQDLMPAIEKARQGVAEAPTGSAG